MAEHIVPKRTYIFVWIALMILTVLTATVSTINLGQFSGPVALAIASIKALLVAMFFMHLRWSGSMMRIVVCAAIFWLAIMISLTLGDILTRGRVAPSEGWHTSTVVLPATAPANQRRWTP